MPPTKGSKLFSEQHKVSSCGLYIVVYTLMETFIQIARQNKIFLLKAQVFLCYITGCIVVTAPAAST
jgi:hypothetical protein